MEEYSGIKIASKIFSSIQGRLEIYRDRLKLINYHFFQRKLNRLLRQIFSKKRN